MAPKYFYQERYFLSFLFPGAIPPVYSFWDYKDISFRKKAEIFSVKFRFYFFNQVIAVNQAVSAYLYFLDLKIRYSGKSDNAGKNGDRNHANDNRFQNKPFSPQFPLMILKISAHDI